MLSSVLNSQRAVLINIAIMRAFVKLRAILAAHPELAKRLESAERLLARHDDELDRQAGEIGTVFETLRQLMEPPASPKPPIGFRP
jgi:hypothetical protein